MDEDVVNAPGSEAAAFTVIVSELLVVVVGEAQDALLVITQLTTSPLFKELLV
jgi:hypothetical protein